MAATMISMIGSETVLPMFVQNLLGRTPIDSGLILLPGAIVMAIMSVISGWLYETFGAKVLAIIGMSIVLITTSYFVVMDEHTSTVMLATVYAIRMIGIAMGLMPIMTHTMNQLTPELNAHGSSMTNTIQQIAGSIGTAGFCSHGRTYIYCNVSYCLCYSYDWNCNGLDANNDAYNESANTRA